jgi:hypothetical protein
MTLNEVIARIDELNEDSVIYAKKQDGKFLSTSEAVVLELAEEEEDLSTNEIANKYCPGFDYFLEVFLVKDMVEELQASDEYKSLDKQVERVIHYAEFDA